MQELLLCSELARAWRATFRRGVLRESIRSSRCVMSKSWLSKRESATTKDESSRAQQSQDVQSDRRLLSWEFSCALGRPPGLKTRRLRINIAGIRRTCAYSHGHEESIFQFWLLVFKLFVLGLFLFEEAAESVYGVGGILPLRFVAAGGRAAAEAAELRFEEIFRQTADIRNKFRLCGRALNLERNFQTFAASTATAPSNRAEKPAEPATRSGGRACRAAGLFCEWGEHCEIESVLRVHRARTGKIAKVLEDRKELVSPHPRR